MRTRARIIACLGFPVVLASMVIVDVLSYILNHWWRWKEYIHAEDVKLYISQREVEFCKRHPKSPAGAPAHPENHQ